MPTDKKHIFISYSHEDVDLTPRVFSHLRGLDHFFPVELWIDQHQIRAGDRWQTEIDKALATADLAVLLISPAFLGSSFIREHEQPKLLKGRDKGLRLIPILLKPCAWPEWLAGTEIRPRGDVALSEIEPAGIDRKLKEVIEEIAALLDPDTVSSDGTGLRADDTRARDLDEQACVSLLAGTVLGDVAEESGAAVAGTLVQGVRRHTGLSGEGLFNAVRFFVEYQLLGGDDPTSPAALERSLDRSGESAMARSLVARLREGGRTGNFSTVPVEVNSRFFGRSNARAELWKKYFDAVVDAGASTKSAITSLASVRVKMGFLSPQFLVAGLLSRFDDDWKLVLNAYQNAIPNRRHRRGAFESLQASQWNCWLMWGPSIPVCQCEQWQGFFALQYGYGDENNSIPVLELVADERGAPKTLGPIIATLRNERRGAKFTMLTGRIRWGPWFLGPHTPVAPDDDSFNAVDIDSEPTDDTPKRFGVAPAQASMYDRGLAHRQDSDGLVFHLEQLDESKPESRVYFSAYLWLMFLVAVPPKNVEEAQIGPGLLRAKGYPAWPERPEERQRVREAKLWSDLLPVFVHANIGDPEALRFQKQQLVQSALNLLQQVWDRRAELFDGEDVKAGIQFHLVCGSDYSGCGCEVRFPADESLVQQLRLRVGEHQDRAFAKAVVLPEADATAVPRPWGLAGYFSACHLPELIVDYYEHVFQVNKGRPRR